MTKKIKHSEFPVNLIGICGKAGAGKDTVADYIASMYGHEVVSFASPLKQLCAVAFDIPYSHFNARDTKEIKNSYWNLSPREMLQLVGTELFRNNFMKNFWAIRAQKFLQSRGITQAIFSDVRFEDEAKYILLNGGILINIVRPSTADVTVGIAGHASEAGIDFNQLDEKGEYTHTIINNGSLEDLETKVYDTLNTVLTKLK